MRRFPECTFRAASSGTCLPYLHGPDGLAAIERLRSAPRAFATSPMYETTTTDSAAMKAEHDYGAHHGDEFGGQWVHVADDQSPHQSPLHEFNGFYMSPPSHMEIESSYFRTTATSHTSNPPLYPLIVPQWPSQLTNPSVNPPSSQPQSCPSAPALAPRPIAPSTSTKSVEAPSTTQSAPFAPAPIPTPSSGRRTLTDQDRRRMCQYHEENPTVKQTEIGCE